MKRMLLIVIIGLVALAGCKNIDNLGPGNELALENQANLESNVTRVMNNFEILSKAQPSWDEGDAAKWEAQKAAILEQLVLNYAWLLVIKEAVEANDLDPKFFSQVLSQAPAWIGEGKKIYDLIKELGKKE